ncbi:hypothetical protein PVAP13_5NG286668 [Panicum virgatum]|uniref:Uncharacterized protein n=1 Tax=Panicum virgatum TaxID=38727 RepID=A0A8T0RUZ0_PANVG|nr:hypothetical protein PVAP13_5NG286668 [Panicum virgatum]
MAGAMVPSTGLWPVKWVGLKNFAGAASADDHILYSLSYLLPSAALSSLSPSLSHSPSFLFLPESEHPRPANSERRALLPASATGDRGGARSSPSRRRRHGRAAAAPPWTRGGGARGARSPPSRRRPKALLPGGVATLDARRRRVRGPEPDVGAALDVRGPDVSFPVAPTRRREGSPSLFREETKALSGPQ